MAFRVRRQARYNKLIRQHFLPFEARALSRLKSNNPFLKELRADRVNTFKQSVKQYQIQGFRFSKTEWKRIITETYKMRGWTETKDPSKLSPWAMYNYFVEQYRNKYPDWESQYEKHQLSRQDFKPKIDGMRKAKKARDAKKYPKGRYYY